MLAPELGSAVFQDEGQVEPVRCRRGCGPGGIFVGMSVSVGVTVLVDVLVGVGISVIVGV